MIYLYALLAVLALLAVGLGLLLLADRMCPTDDVKTLGDGND